MPDLTTMQAAMKPWANARHPMGTVTRWGNFPEYRQTLLMHNSSVPLTLMHVLMVLRHHASGLMNEIDQTLLYEAFAVHDLGEPLTGGDEHIDARTEGKEVREWVAFAELVKDLPLPLQQRYLVAFTLQYVRKPAVHTTLPMGAMWALNLCVDKYQYEAIIFEFVERLDYFLTALDGHCHGVENDDEAMLEHCYKNQAPKLGKLCEELPALRHVWTPQLREELAALAGV